LSVCVCFDPPRREYGIPVVIKYIADPTMHSMPSVAMHPNNNWIACQSMDNQIVVYSTKERFRVNHKKVFSGHHNAGYVRVVCWGGLLNDVLRVCPNSPSPVSQLHSCALSPFRPRVYNRPCEGWDDLKPMQRRCDRRRFRCHNICESGFIVHP